MLFSDVGGKMLTGETFRAIIGQRGALWGLGVVRNIAEHQGIKLRLKGSTKN